MRKVRGIIASVLATTIVAGPCQSIAASTEKISNSKITVDYNTSIGTGSKYLFGGVNSPSTNEASAWSKLKEEMGVKLIKMPIDLGRLYPNENGEIDTNVLEEYLHVASGQFTRAKGAGIELMLEFVNMPGWLDLNNDKKYDDEFKYTSMIKEFLNSAVEYHDIIKSIEITPSEELSNSDFSDVYFSVAKAVKSVKNDFIVGGPGYVLKGNKDSTLGKVRYLLEAYKGQENKDLLQFVSLRADSVDSTNSNSDYFGEFKEGRKNIRNWSGNADLPLVMTGWTTVSKDASSPNNTITGIEGIQQQAVALFKAMRDGWDSVLFNSTTSNVNSPATYAYTIDNNGEIIMNPFAKTWDLLTDTLKLGEGNFKVVSTNMGSDWPVDDSIAMVNSLGEPVILATNFREESLNVKVELKNIPYKDGKVRLECYTANSGSDQTKPYAVVDADVINGIVTANIPSITSNGVTGIIVRGGEKRNLPAQTLYEFESQDNHFGGNTEITWETNASFNRVVKNFGGENNFVKLKNVEADGTGVYTAKLYGSSRNSQVKISVNGDEPININASSISLNNPVEFDINLDAGKNNIKVWTDSGELRADKLVLVPKEISLSIGFQNLNSLASENEGENKRYILPLQRTDFVVDGRIMPENASEGKELIYESSNSDIVSIDNNGLLTPKSTGEVTITASIKDNLEIKNSFRLVVKNSVAGISVSPEKLTLRPNQQAKVKATLRPDNTENKNVTWKSSNESIVRIIERNNSEVIIEAISNSGNAILTATSEDGGYSANSSISIINPESAGIVEIDYGNTIANGSNKIFGVTHYPSLNKKDNDVGDHSMVWEMLRDDMGVKFMRADARLQEILPIWVKTPNTNWASNSDIQPGQPNYVEADYYYVTGPDGVKRQFSIEGYREDMDYYKEHGKYLNGLSNPENWNTERLMNWVKKAKEMNFEVMVMTFQIPEWLASGYPNPGAPHTEKACNSAPKDWEIFRDMIKKVYTMVRPYADYYELLNEPHWYVPEGGDQRRPDGTPYTSSNKKNLIATDMFYESIDAMYEAEKEITGNHNAKPKLKLGGGSDDSWGGDYGVLGTIFSEEFEKWHDRVEFISIHKYGARPANQNMSNDGANTRNFKHWLRQKTKKELPIFLNEYNASTGQPHEYHTGAKSMAYHGRNLIDMMIDGYDGGGYYTCYPSDVPMDDYEASSGWIERGKGVYAWNNGNPTLATFTKTWSLLSKTLNLGAGDFKVKSTSVTNSKISDAVGAVNFNNEAIAFVTNYGNEEFRDLSVEMRNIPYKVGNKVKAKIYSMSVESDINMEPMVEELTVKDDGSLSVNVDYISNFGVVGIVIEGDTINKEDKTIEFESYLNSFNGNSKINVEESASNGRWVTNISNGSNNSVEVNFEAMNKGKYNLELFYNTNKNTKIKLVINNEEERSIDLELTDGIQSNNFDLVLQKGKNNIKVYNEENNPLNLDKLRLNYIEEEKPVLDKSQLKALVDENEGKNPEDYTEESFNVFKEAMNKAIRILEDNEATQEQIDEAFENLTSAIGGLIEIEKDPEKPAIDKEKLKFLVEENKNKKAEDYTEESFNVFKEAMNKAIKILEDNEATQEQIDEAFENLTSAVGGLIEIEKEPEKPSVNKDDLKELIEKNKDKKPNDYTSESFKVFKDSMDTAIEILNSSKATQESVDKALENLKKAIDQLIEVDKKPNEEKVDKTKLEFLVKDNEIRKAEDYTEKSWNTFEMAMKKSKEVLNDKDATQNEVDQTFKFLSDAIEGLVNNTDVLPNTGTRYGITTNIIISLIMIFYGAVLFKKEERKKI